MKEFSLIDEDSLKLIIQESRAKTRLFFESKGYNIEKVKIRFEYQKLLAELRDIKDDYEYKGKELFQKQIDQYYEGCDKMLSKRYHFIPRGELKLEHRMARNEAICVNDYMESLTLKKVWIHISKKLRGEKPSRQNLDHEKPFQEYFTNVSDFNDVLKLLISQEFIIENRKWIGTKGECVDLIKSLELKKYYNQHLTNKDVMSIVMKFFSISISERTVKAHKGNSPVFNFIPTLD